MKQPKEDLKQLEVEFDKEVDRVYVDRSAMFKGMLKDFGKSFILKAYQLGQGAERERLLNVLREHAEKCPDGTVSKLIESIDVLEELNTTKDNN